MRRNKEDSDNKASAEFIARKMSVRLGQKCNFFIILYCTILCQQISAHLSTIVYYCAEMLKIFPQFSQTFCGRFPFFPIP